MGCCSVKNVLATVASFIVFSSILIIVDFLYLSRLNCRTIRSSDYSLPSQLINTETFNTTIISKELSLVSKDHIAVHCSTPTSLNRYSFEGIINAKTRLREGPGSTHTDYVEFDVWYSNDQPNGSGRLRYKATAFEEEGGVKGSWKDGKLECDQCELLLHLDEKNDDRMIYVGPIKNNFIHGDGGVLKMISKSTADGTTFPFTINGLRFEKGNSKNVKKSQNVTITLPFENNTTRVYKIKKMNNLWNGLMDRFGGEKCEVVYVDPNSNEKTWNCDEAMIDRMDEDYRIRGVLVNLIRFELYWSTKAMGRIPNYKLHINEPIAKIKDEL